MNPYPPPLHTRVTIQSYWELFLSVRSLLAVNLCNEVTGYFFFAKLLLPRTKKGLPVLAHRPDPDSVIEGVIDRVPPYIDLVTKLILFMR